MKFKIWIIQTFFRIALFWWKYWSKIYRFLYQRRYSVYKLPNNISATRACKEMKKLTWTKDGTKELWDVCGSPNWVQYTINQIDAGKQQPKGSLDCDDFTSWAVSVLHEKYNPRIFTFMWVGKSFDTKESKYSNKLHGHAMCLCTDKNGKIFHIGNWGKSKQAENLKTLCNNILKKTNGTNPVVWSILDKKLNVLEYGAGLPNENIK